MVDSINSGNNLGVQSLQRAQDLQNTASQRIASGRAINTAADDAAGLALVNRFTAQQTAFEQAGRNAGDALSLTQVADGGLASVNDSLQRIRELALQAANDTLQDSDRNALQAEFVQLRDQVFEVVANTRFNGVDILQRDQDIAVQLQPGSSIELNLRDVGRDLGELDLVNIANSEQAQRTLEVADQALQAVTEQRQSIGVSANRLDAAVSSLDNERISSAASRSRIEDADIARERSQQILAQVQQQAGIAIQAQANGDAKLALRLLS